ncbi:hypothetical protein V8F20_010608 [Naviculisporaceae sp. PSN 640]
MAGRRKRSPGGGTAGERGTRYVKEESILYPKPLDMPDEHWPCYVLTDATVYRSDGKTIANPLHVNLDGPMVIRGRMSIDSSEGDAIANLVNPAIRTAYIEIKGSDRYSIGYDPTTLWLSGSAGWFEIVPSPEYEAMYREVQDGITLYYSVIEVYEEHEQLCAKRKKAKKGPPPPPTLDDILFRYANTLGNGIFRDEAEARCHKWAQFLIAHLSRELDIQSNDTLFAQWMREKHPELTQRIKDASAGLIPPAPIPPSPEPAKPSHRRGRPSKTSARSSEDVEMTDPDSSLFSDSAKSKTRLVSNTPVPLPTYATRQPPPSQSPAPQESSPPRVGSEPASGNEPFSIIDRLIEVFKEEVAEKNIDVRKAAETRFHQAIWGRCRVRQYPTATHIMEYYAPELLAALPSEWRNSRFYEWLRQKASGPRSLPEGLTLDDIAVQLVRRVKKTKPQPSSTAPLDLQGLEARNRGARKSSQNFDEAEEPPRHGKRLPVSIPRRSGKGAVLRPQTSKKRPASDMNLDDDDEDDDDSISEVRPGRKLAKRNRGLVDDDDMDDNSDDSGVIAGDIFPISTHVPKDAVRVLVHSGRLPTMSPSGPDGTWICEQEGCGYVVREAEDQVGQELIQKHLDSHQSQAERISLAVAESRGQMPIKYVPLFLLAAVPVFTRWFYMV